MSSPLVPALPPVGRRAMLGGLGAVPALLASQLLAPAAWAAASRSPDVVVFCDPAVRGAVRTLGLSFRRQAAASLVPLCTAARIMAAQLVRGERNDLLITLSPVVGQCIAAGLVVATAVPGWHNPVVLASAEPGDADAGDEHLRRILANEPLAGVDASPNAVIDTGDVLRRLGIDRAPGAAPLAGAIDTETVAWALATRRARFGLMLLSDARGHDLAVVGRLPESACPPIRYAVAMNKHAMSRNTAAFLEFLASSQAGLDLAASGLEVSS